VFIFNRDKAITELFSLAQPGVVREGEFCLTVRGFFAQTQICLSIQAPQQEARPLPAEPAQEALPARDRSAPPPIRTYQTTPYFLRQCHRQLFTDNDGKERELIISGPSFPQDDRHILDILVAVKLATASRTGCEADIPDLFRHLTALDAGHGLLLLGVFHSHLSLGRSAVTPSDDKDRVLQQTLEESGYKTVQAIFSQDVNPYVGFFTNTIPFRLEVLGTGYEEVERHATQTIIRLTQASHLSDQAVYTQTPAGASLRRSAESYPRV
jgi:hypothetical protein